MKKIFLTPNKHHKFVLVDNEDYKWLNQYTWYFTNVGYATTEINYKRYLMHRLIMKTPKGMDTDHINHNILDNRRENLRIATRAQNNANGKGRKHTSIYKGICWVTEKKKWKAQIAFNKKTIHLGYFNNELRASKIYDKKARELYGEFALSNNPQLRKLDRIAEKMGVE